MTTLRYVLVALLLLTLLFLLGGHARAASYTVPRDTSGTPAAECAFLGSTGVSTLCSATDPLPTVNVGTTPAPTSPSTDPVGWAQQWFTGSATGASTTAPLFPIFLADNTAVGFASAESGVTVDEWVSSDKGRTWTKKGTVAFGTEGWTVNGGILLPDGAYLLYGNANQALPGTTGVGRLNANGTASVIAPVGVTAGFQGGGISAAVQGTTVGLIWVRASDGEAFFCKSTDTGATFACGTSNYTILPINNGKAVDSPAPNIWIRATADGVQRSVDNATTFTTALSGVTGTNGILECISSTVCLFTNGQDKIYRSTDAGATWSLRYTSGVNPLFGGFVDYGSGFVAAVPRTFTANIYVSRDSGASWTPAYTVTATGSRCNTPCQATAVDGSAIYSAAAATNTGKVRYSPSVGQGTTLLVGADGTPIAVDSSGRITANQGVTTASPATGGNNWSWVVLTNGTFEIGRSGFPLQVAPVQGDTLLNSSATGAANTAVVATLTPAAANRAHLYAVAAFCSAGSATLTILDGATPLWTAPAGTVTTTLFTATWPVGLTGTTGAAVTVTLSTCGVGNTGTLSVQADQF